MRAHATYAARRSAGRAADPALPRGRRGEAATHELASDERADPDAEPGAAKDLMG